MIFTGEEGAVQNDPEDGVEIFTNGTLFIRSVIDDDYGSYICSAKNKEGQTRVQIEVNRRKFFFTQSSSSFM